MPIEVKQLVVRGEIQRAKNESAERDEYRAVDVDALKAELLEVCRRMLEDALRQSRER
jgi:hypothetical protein